VDCGGFIIYIKKNNYKILQYFSQPTEYQNLYKWPSQKQRVYDFLVVVDVILEY